VHLATAALASSFRPAGQERSPKFEPQHAPTVTNKAEKKNDLRRIAPLFAANYATNRLKCGE